MATQSAQAALALSAIKTLARTFAAVLALSLSAPARSDESGNGALAEVIVTGTRQTGVLAAQSASPIQIIGAEALAAASANGELVATLAALIPSLTAQAYGGDMGNLALQAKLRGLSPNHVLVLVDGKRRHTTANLAVLGGPYQGGAGVDLNFIPVSAIDHIEVLTEGAAAQYGTDAIAGVINIILKTSATGAEVSTTHGGYFKGDGPTHQIAGNAGFAPVDGAYLNVTGEVGNHGHSFSGGIDPRVIDPANVASYPNSNMPGIPGYPYLNRIAGDAEYHLKVAAFNTGLPLNDGGELYAVGTYGQKDANSIENYRLPTKAVYKDPVSGVVTYRFPLGFNPREAIEETDYGLTLGFKGVTAGWHWDLASVYGADSVAISTIDSINVGLYGSVGASPSSFADGRFKASQWTTSLDVGRDVVVGLAEPLMIAMGGEYRRDTYAIGSGSADSYIDGGAASYPGFTPTDAGVHARDNYAAYIDLAAHPTSAWSVDAAGRYERYSDFGSTTVGKLTSRYEVSPLFALRGTVSTGFRAPTLAEEYYSSTNVAPLQAFVQLPPNARAASLLGVGEGLKPEASTNVSVGAVWRPSPHLLATLDLYRIKIRNRIVGSGAIYGTINGTVVAPDVVAAIIANGNALDPTVISTGVNIFENGVDTRTQGADLTVTLPALYDFGSIDWSIGATYNDTLVTRVAASPPQLDGQALFDKTALSDLTTAAPRYVVNLGALVRVGKWSVTARESIYGPSSEYGNDNGDATGTPIYYSTRIPTTPITALDVAYDMTTAIRISVGANNLFNRFPPPINSRQLAAFRAADDNAAVAIHPAFSPFGINGGTYYAKLRVRF